MEVLFSKKCCKIYNIISIEEILGVLNLGRELKNLKCIELAYSNALY